MTNIAAAVIESRRGLVFQRRPAGHELIGEAALGCFTGFALPGESTLDALIRSLAEDTGVAFRVNQLGHLASVNVAGIKLPSGETVDVRSAVFQIDIANKPFNTDLIRGSVEVVPVDELDSVMGEFDPVTKAIFKESYV